MQFDAGGNKILRPVPMEDILSEKPITIIIPIAIIIFCSILNSLNIRLYNVLPGLQNCTKIFVPRISTMGIED